MTGRVVSFSGGDKSGGGGGADEAWMQRQALMIASQLPEKETDAMRVLSYAQQIIIFLSGPKQT